MASSKETGVLSISSAALRKMIIDPLNWRKINDKEAVSDDAPLADDSINAIIEGEIIPRLLMAHASGGQSFDQRNSEITPDDAKRFADLPLRLEAASLLEEVDNFLAQGVSVEAIYIDLLAPAARQLGELWEEDACDFVDVTMGLWRLQEVMREISARAPLSHSKGDEKAHSALFFAMPGDQHTFGALMLDEVFARAGWKSGALQKVGRREILEQLSHEFYDVVGLTLSRDCPSAAVSKLISAMRSVSLNPNIFVLIGGRAVNEDPSIVAMVGADGTGTDARAALSMANKLVTARAARA